MVNILVLDHAMSAYADIVRPYGNIVTLRDKWEWNDISFVLFTGGADVSPELYGEENIYSFNDWGRDVVERDVWQEAKNIGIPCVGICRGAQFLNVMNGGRMIQDVNNHTRPHMMETKDGSKFLVASTHHQMMIPTRYAEWIAWADKATYFSSPDKPWHDTEVIWYPKTKDLCVQYHPEQMSVDSAGYGYFHELLKEYVLW